MRLRPLANIFAFGSVMLAATALAQDASEGGPPAGVEDSVFSGDYLSVGVGAALNPSYTGSDDYVVTVLPIIQGSLGGIDINPRAGGLKLDFVQDPAEGIAFDAGIAARIRGNRNNQIKDEVVLQYGELDTAIEVGPQ